MGVIEELLAGYFDHPDDWGRLGVIADAYRDEGREAEADWLMGLLHDQHAAVRVRERLIEPCQSCNPDDQLIVFTPWLSPRCPACQGRFWVLNTRNAWAFIVDNTIRRYVSKPGYWIRREKEKGPSRSRRK